jgi:large subunit ribosomal protein L35
MPKQKTKKAAAKRFRVTGTGKFTYAHANRNKYHLKKTAKRKRTIRKMTVLDKTNEAAVKKMLPYA